jgi:hypothetical protein
MDIDTERFRTTFAGVSLVEGDPHPRLYYRHEADRGDGMTKTLSGAAEVRDEATLLRIERELRPGDEIEIDVSVDWDAPGVPPVLAGFRRIEGAVAAA